MTKSYKLNYNLSTPTPVASIIQCDKLSDKEKEW